MISRQTGEILFLNGIGLKPDMLLPLEVLRESAPRALENMLADVHEMREGTWKYWFPAKVTTVAAEVTRLFWLAQPSRN